MKIIPTEIDGVLLIEPRVFSDQRGYFLETYHRRRYREAGMQETFVQDNFSSSVRDTLRGLHFQVSCPQAKLVQALMGEIFDVALDIRPNSKTFGKWSGALLSDQNKRQLFIPQGFAHGFCVISEKALVHYKCSDFYSPADEGGVLWSDPSINIDWPVKTPLLSEKDKRLPRLSDLPAETLNFRIAT
jgi:dTDP-4-dehydrorhamnose 3,5-epimerase